MYGKKIHRYLGNIFTHVAGIQYYSGAVKPGDSVLLKRDPGNQHDPNAVKVLNTSLAQIGNLPRYLVNWLSPLLDSRKIKIKGAIPFGDISQRPDRYPLELAVSLNPQGESIFTEKHAPSNVFEAFHYVVLRAYNELESHKDPDIAFSLGERFSDALKKGGLPETFLLVNLFKSHGMDFRELRKEDCLKRIREHLSQISIGEPQHFLNLTFYPIYSSNGGRSKLSLLDTAVKKGQVEISEISESGSVPHVSLVNHGKKPVLLAEGDILIGAKQNRVINISMVADVGQAMVIPVSCVERGRWSSVSRAFASGYVAPPGLRAKKTQSVNMNRSMSGKTSSDQGSVWKEVDSYLDSLGMSSPTDDITHAMRQSRARLSLYRRNLKIPTEARGMIAVSGERMLGMDIFDSPETLRKCWSKLAEAYFMEAMIGAGTKKKTGRAAVESFVSSVAENISIKGEQIGGGTEFMVQTAKITGSGVWFDSKVCHLAAFKVL